METNSLKSNYCYKSVDQNVSRIFACSNSTTYFCDQVRFKILLLVEFVSKNAIQYIVWVNLNNTLSCNTDQSKLTFVWIWRLPTTRDQNNKLNAFILDLVVDTWRHWVLNKWFVRYFVFPQVCQKKHCSTDAMKFREELMEYMRRAKKEGVFGLIHTTCLETWNKSFSLCLDGICL